MRIEFTVMGRPQPKERPRVTSRGTFTPTKTRKFEEKVGVDAWKAVMTLLPDRFLAWPMDAEYALSCHFFAKGKRKMDVDNMLKSVGDGLEGVLFKNDNQIVEVHGYRTMGCAESEERTEVVLEVLE